MALAENRFKLNFHNNIYTDLQLKVILMLKPLCGKERNSWMMCMTKVKGRKKKRKEGERKEGTKERREGIKGGLAFKIHFDETGWATSGLITQ